MPEIVSLLPGDQSKRFSITFESQNTMVLDLMVGHFGKSKEEVVFKALSLLYTIHSHNDQAKTVILENKSGKQMIIPL